MGRPFLQIPGPTNVPDRILRAMNRQVIDHRGGEFAALTGRLLPRLRTVFGSRDGAVVLYPGSGTGAWEASLVNVLKPGDRVLAVNNGHFSEGFARAARNLGFDVDEVVVPRGAPAEAAPIAERLRADSQAKRYAALLVVHNETSTGVISDIAAVRAALDETGHDALLIVDAVSSLGSAPVLFDDWRVDVCLAASQKGLMLPPGIGVVCVGPRALAAAEHGGSPRHYFDWRSVIRDNAAGFFPYTPATLLLFGLDEALTMLVDEEGLDRTFQRHARLAGGVRAAVHALGLRTVSTDDGHSSPTVTAVSMPDGSDSSDLIAHARERYSLSLGVGMGDLRGRVFRIGHLGALNELEVLATLAGVELSLAGLGIGVPLGAGVEACERAFLADPGFDASAPREQVAAAPA